MNEGPQFLLIDNKHDTAAAQEQGQAAAGKEARLVDLGSLGSLTERSVATWSLVSACCEWFLRKEQLRTLHSSGIQEILEPRLPFVSRGRRVLQHVSPEDRATWRLIRRTHHAHLELILSSGF